VTAVSFVGPNRVAAGNNLGEILIWELPGESGGTAPKPVRRLVGHTNTVTRLLSTPDGRWLISASNDRSVRYWDLQVEAKGEEAIVLNARAREDAIKRKSSKVPPPIEAKLAVQEAARVLTGHKDWVLGLGLSADGNTLVSGDDKGDVIMWDRPNAKEVRRWKVKGWVWALALAPDASSVCVSERVHLVFDSGRHQGLKLWDAQKGEVKHDLTKAMAKEMPIAAAAYSPDGKVLAVGRGGEVDGNNGKVTLLDAADGKKLRELTPGHLNGLTDIVFSPDGKHVLSSGRDTVVRVWNVADGKLVKELGAPRGGQFKDWIHAVAVSPDARWVAAADMAGQVQMWSLAGK
jgi:WD40 repeat protein